MPVPGRERGEKLACSIEAARRGAEPDNREVVVASGGELRLDRERLLGGREAVPTSRGFRASTRVNLSLKALYAATQG